MGSKFNEEIRLKLDNSSEKDNFEIAKRLYISGYSNYSRMITHSNKYHIFYRLPKETPHTIELTRDMSVRELLKSINRRVSFFSGSIYKHPIDVFYFAKKGILNFGYPFKLNYETFKGISLDVFARLQLVFNIHSKKHAEYIIGEFEGTKSESIKAKVIKDIIEERLKTLLNEKKAFFEVKANHAKIHSALDNYIVRQSESFDMDMIVDSLNDYLRKVKPVCEVESISANYQLSDHSKKLLNEMKLRKKE